MMAVFRARFPSSCGKHHIALTHPPAYPCVCQIPEARVKEPHTSKPSLFRARERSSWPPPCTASPWNRGASGSFRFLCVCCGRPELDGPSSAGQHQRLMSRLRLVCRGRAQAPVQEHAQLSEVVPFDMPYKAWSW